MEEVILNLPRMREVEDDAEPEPPTYTPATFWKGLIWSGGSGGISQTCNQDSFLSHVVYLARFSQGYFRKNLHLKEDRGEAAVLGITSSEFDWMTAQQHSDRAHRAWCNVAFDSSAGIAEGDTSILDVRGCEASNVFAHLKMSSQIWFVHSCGCQVSTHVPASSAKVAWNPTTLNNLNAKTATTTLVTHKSKKKCKTCSKNFLFQRAIVAETTWFHSFDIEGQSNDIYAYPLTLEFQTIGSSSSSSYTKFDLAYFTYSSKGAHGTLTHQVSIHWIFARGYMFYDGMSQSGQLQPIPSNIKTDYYINSVTYFKRM
jgi:hypothetical protein